MLIISFKHLEIYTKTISRLRLGDHKPIFTSPSAQFSNSGNDCKLLFGALGNQFGALW